MGTRLLTQRPNKRLNKHQKSQARSRLVNQKHTTVSPRQTEIFPEIPGRSNFAPHFDYNFSQIGVFANEGGSSFPRDLSHFEYIDVFPAVSPPVEYIQISDPDSQRRNQTKRNLKSIVSGLNNPFGELYIHVDSKARRNTLARATVGHLEGNHIYLNPERYRSDTALGRRILAHELAHASQRKRKSSSGLPRDLLEVAAELEAVLIANAYVGGSRFQPPVLHLPAGSVPAFTSVDPAVLMEDLKDAFYRAILRKTGIHPPKMIQEFLLKLKDAFITGANDLESMLLGALAKSAHLIIKFPVSLDLREINKDLYADFHLEADPEFRHLKVAGSFRLGFWGIEIIVGQRSGEELQIYIPWNRDQNVHGSIPRAQVGTQDGHNVILKTGSGKFTSKEIQLDFAALRLPELGNVITWSPEAPMLRAEKIVITGGSGLQFDKLGLFMDNFPKKKPSLRVGGMLAVEDLNLDAQPNAEPDADASSGMSLSLSAGVMKFEIPGVDLKISRPKLLYDSKAGSFKLSADATDNFKFFGTSAQLTDIAFETGPKGFKGGFHINETSNEGPRAKFFIDSTDSTSVSLKAVHAKWKIPILKTLALDISLIQVGKESTIEGISIQTGLGSVIFPNFNLPDLDSSFSIQDLIGGKIPFRSVEFPLPSLTDDITWKPWPSIGIGGFNLTGDGPIFDTIGFHGEEKFTLKFKEIMTVKDVEFNANQESISTQPDRDTRWGICITASAGAIDFALPEIIGGPLTISGPTLAYKLPTNNFNLSVGSIQSNRFLGKTVELQNIYVKRDSEGFRGGLDVTSNYLSSTVEITPRGVTLNQFHFQTKLGSILVERIQFWGAPAMYNIIVKPESDIIKIEPFSIREFDPYRFFELIKAKADDIWDLIREIRQSVHSGKEGEILSEEQVASAKDWYAKYSGRYPSHVVTRIEQKVGAKPDGIMDSHCIRSIAGWQKENRLEVDGKAGSATLVEMFGRDIRAVPEGDRKFETRKGAEPKIDEEDASFKDTVMGYLDKFVLFPDLSEEPSTNVSPDAALPTIPEEDRAIVSPPRRKPKHRIVKGKNFKREMDGQALDANLVNQIEKMAKFAIEKDLVSGDIWYTSGMRSLKDAHRMSTAWSIREGRVTRKHLKNFKNSKGQLGVDEDGTRWIKPGWTAAKIKKVATKEWSGAQAAEGYPKGDKRRRPNTYKYVTKHATGRAMDAVYPWVSGGQVKNSEALEKLKSEIIKKYKNRPKAKQNKLETIDKFVARGSYSNLAVKMVETFRLRRPLLHSKSTEDWHYELAKDYKPDQVVNEQTERQQAEKVARESMPVTEVTKPAVSHPEVKKEAVEKTATKTTIVTVPKSASPAESWNADTVLRRFATFLPFTDTYVSLDEEGLGQFLSQFSARSELIRSVLDRLDPEDCYQVSRFLQKTIPEESVGFKETFSGQTFTIEDSNSILRDDALKPLKYKKGDEIPKGKRVGDSKTVPKTTRVQVGATKTNAKKTTYALVYKSDTSQSLGWTAVTNFRGGFENVVTGMSRADDVSAPTSDNKYTVRDPRALIREGGPKYEPKGTTILTGTYVSVQQRSLDTKPAGKYVLVKEVLHPDKDFHMGEELGWTAESNLQAGWADIFGPNAAWEKVKYIGQVDLVDIVGTKGETEKITTESFPPYMSMVNAAANAGVHVGLNSGFRTYGQQESLRRLYEKGKGNLASRPGHSNHQNGKAFDLNTTGNAGTGWGPLYDWLKKNAWRYGFIRTVPSEHWHWEYRPERVAKGKHTTWGA